MRYILFLLFLFSGLYSVKGQDIIVRITGDTLHVKVDHANDDFLYYQSTNTKKGEIDVISRLEVSSVLYNFETAPADLRKVRRRLDRGYDIIEGWFLYGGYFLPITYTGSDQFRDYYQKLQFGSGFRGGLQFFVNKDIGVGASYSQSRYRNSTDVQNIITGQVGKLQNDILLKYTGAAFIFRIDLEHIQSKVELFAGIGYTWYSDNAKQIDSYVLTGEGFTGNISAAFNISIGQGIFIPIKLAVDGINVGDLRIELKDETTDIAKELIKIVDNMEQENVTRISASVGLLFSF